MFTQSTDIYDKIYAFKDYQAAADKVHRIIQAHSPGARSLLDVACGTGGHLQFLQREYDVEGLDLNAALIDQARAKCPGGPFHLSDMLDLSLPHSFDVITCLFSSIGYLETPERLELAVARMREHLNPGGLILIEPYFTPEQYWDNHLLGNFVDEPDLKVSWIYLNGREGHVSVLDIHYTVGTREGVRQFRELHRVGLFTHEEYLGAFAKVGMTAEFEPEGLFQRGLFIAQLPERASS
jgi:SAM-dependent methyltransferase